MLERDVDWYLGWLARDRTFSPQSYYHLAKIFRAAGHIEKANDILYAVQERERKLTTGLIFVFLIVVVIWSDHARVVQVFFALAVSFSTLAAADYAVQFLRAYRIYRQQSPK